MKSSAPARSRQVRRDAAVPAGAGTRSTRTATGIRLGRLPWSSHWARARARRESRRPRCLESVGRTPSASASGGHARSRRRRDPASSGRASRGPRPCAADQAPAARSPAPHGGRDGSWRRAGRSWSRDCPRSSCLRPTGGGRCMRDRGHRVHRTTGQARRDGPACARGDRCAGTRGPLAAIVVAAGDRRWKESIFHAHKS